MIIKELNLKNWMIFRGEQSIQFASGEANITLIFGENMHGKTSLLNAIRWAMYGKAINRQGKAIPNAELINTDASRGGEFDTGVDLTFDVDDTEYRIHRKIDFSNIRGEMSTSLKVNGRAVDAGNIEATIERLLPEMISQFMLFDGELLKQFEALVVAEGTAQATGIKNAIEDTLGIPVLQKTEDAIEMIEKKLIKERNLELQKDSESKLVAGKLQEFELKINTMKVERQEAIHKKNAYEDEISEIRVTLDEADSALRLIEKKNYALNSRKELKQAISIDATQLKQLAKELWVWPLENALSKTVKDLNKKLEQLNKARDAIATKSQTVSKIKKALEATVCPTCGAEVNSEQMSSLKTELTQLERDLEEVSDTDELIFETTTRLRKLAFSEDINDGRAEYSILSKNLARDEGKLLALENEVYDIEQQLKGVDEHTSLLARQKYDSINGEIAVLKKMIFDFDEKLIGLDKDIKEIQKSVDFQRVSQHSTIIERTNKAGQIKDIVANAVLLYRDEMRKKVQDRATETFSFLTTEKEFDKLEINDSYGLNLVVDGTVVNRSAGAEQIVAISLIEALNFNGRRKGPMIMDTPVGRLDRLHRANILAHLPTVVTQLGIFVHSGELTEDDQAIDEKSVGARYRIERQSTFHSEIIRM